MDEYIPERFMVSPPREVTEALGRCAADEHREPREQAALLIEEGLLLRGYLEEGAQRVVVYVADETVCRRLSPPGRAAINRLVAALQDDEGCAAPVDAPADEILNLEPKQEAE
jgi:hypothetical protein